MHTRKENTIKMNWQGIPKKFFPTQSPAAICQQVGSYPFLFLRYKYEENVHVQIMKYNIHFLELQMLINSDKTHHTS